MPDLLIDTTASRHLAAQAITAAGRLDAIASSVLAAQALSELAVGAVTSLREAADKLRSTSAALVAAADHAETFRLPPISVQDDRPLHRITQISSHNTYLDQRGLAAVLASGVTSIELDLHRGAPTDLSWHGEGAAAWFGRTMADAMTHDAGWPGDWHVYHHSLDPASTETSLRVALHQVGAAATVDPVTVFLDLKDPLRSDHDPAALDALLVETLGDRLWRPADLWARAASSPTLLDAVQTVGWPAAADLRGRVVIVLTDEVDEYAGRSVADAAAFVARPPDALDADTVVVNVHADRIDARTVSRLQRGGRLVRVWGGTESTANHQAIDLEVRAK